MDVEMQSSDVLNGMHATGVGVHEDNDRAARDLDSTDSTTTNPRKSTTDVPDLLNTQCTLNWYVLTFLRVNACFWPSNESFCDLDKIWFMFTRTVNICSVITNFIYIWLILFVFSYTSSTLRFSSAGIDLAIVIRTISVLPVQYINQQRLHKPANTHDTLMLPESVYIATIFGVVSTTATFVGMMLMFFGTMPTNSISFLTEYFLGMYLTFNMFFLVLDIKVCSLLLDQLHVLADSKQLTMNKYMQVKDEIHRRVRESRWASDLIIVPCIASVVAIAVLVVFFLDRDIDTKVTHDVVGFIAYMMKELVFVAVAFWYVAKFNASADELTVKLSRTLWGKYVERECSTVNTVDEKCVDEGSTEQMSTMVGGIEDGTPLLTNTVQIEDVYRLSIHASSQSEPISFTLLFKRLTWVNVAVSAGGFCCTLLLAIVRSFYL